MEGRVRILEGRVFLSNYSGSLSLREQVEQRTYRKFTLAVWLNVVG
jgi:hypothetical protein